jgi:hypothetical protein
MTQELLKEYFNYDAKNGGLVWKKKTSKYSNIKIGSKLGTLNPRGYMTTRLFGVRYKVHNLVWLYHNGELPTLHIDHINHTKNDNRIENLREVSNLENGKNLPLFKNNNTGHIGVEWYKQTNRWRAGIRVCGKYHHLGYFKQKEEAIKARKEAEMKYGFHENHGKERVA